MLNAEVLAQFEGEGESLPPAGESARSSDILGSSLYDRIFAEDELPLDTSDDAEGGSGADSSIPIPDESTGHSSEADDPVTQLANDIARRDRSSFDEDDLFANLAALLD